MGKSGGKGVVIGGSNVDIRGRVKGEVEWNTSNPALISTSQGGVGRNIAENLARLGLKTSFISAVGDDFSGRQILENTGEAGVDVSRVHTCSSHNTGTYLAFLEVSGDMLLGMSDMDVLETIGPEYIESQLDILQNADFVVADTNLSPGVLEAIGGLRARLGFALILETVSVAKAPRAAPHLSGLKVLATNREELRAIKPLSLETPSDLNQAGRAIIDMGCEILLLKMGPAGLYVHQGQEGIHLKPEKVEIKDATGAGDSLVAAFVAGLQLGWDLEKCSRLALKVARLTLEWPGSVSPRVNPALMEEE